MNRGSIKSWVLVGLAAIPAMGRAATVTLDWTPVTQNADGSGFASPGAPTPSELSAYRVFYRATPFVGLTTATVAGAPGVSELAAAVGPGPSATVPNLSDGTSYYFRVTARDLPGNQSAFSLDVNDQDMDVSTCTPAPGAPVNVGATPVSYQQVQFTWRDNSGGESGFRIERSSPDNANYSLLMTSAAIPGTGTVRIFVDGGLTAQTTYYYRIRANGTATHSGYVEVSAVTPPAPTVPPVQPTNLRATSVTNNQVNLAWNHSTGDETGFELRWSLNGTSGWTVIPLPLDTNTYAHGSLPAGTSYYYQIRAVNGAGNPAFSPVTPILAKTTGGGTTPSVFTPPPGLKEAYCYPNPAVGVDPVIRAMMGGVDSVEITIFDQSGRAVVSDRVTQGILVNGQPAYEYAWKGEKASGVYYAVIHGRKGTETIRARTKFAVVR